MLMAFQNSKKHISKENSFYEVPVCYKTTNEEFNESLYFEDLKCHGYEMFDRHKNVSMEHSILVMKVLAKLHALSFGLRVSIN